MCCYLCYYLIINELTVHPVINEFAVPFIVSSFPFFTENGTFLCNEILIKSEFSVGVNYKRSRSMIAIFKMY